MLACFQKTKQTSDASGFFSLCERIKLRSVSNEHTGDKLQTWGVSLVAHTGQERGKWLFARNLLLSYPVLHDGARWVDETLMFSRRWARKGRAGMHMAVTSRSRRGRGRSLTLQSEHQRRVHFRPSCLRHGNDVQATKVWEISCVVRRHHCLFLSLVPALLVVRTLDSESKDLNLILCLANFVTSGNSPSVSGNFLIGKRRGRNLECLGSLAALLWL